MKKNKRVCIAARKKFEFKQMHFIRKTILFTKKKKDKTDFKTRQDQSF